MSERFNPEVLRPEFEFRPELRPEAECLQVLLHENQGKDASKLSIPEEGMILECPVEGCETWAFVASNAGVLAVTGMSNASSCVR